MDMNFDPVLQQGQDGGMTAIAHERERLARQMEELRRNWKQPQPENGTPVWDEIDRITQGLTSGEFRCLSDNAEFQESNALVTSLLQREYMRMMRPLVEGTRDGKEALEKHLTLLKRLVKSAKDDAERKSAMMSDYMENHADMTFNDYIKMMKKGGKK